MRPAFFLALSLVATAAFAQNIRFDPPNPTSRTPITAHVTGNWSGCSLTTSRNGSFIDLTLENCSLQVPPPAVDLSVDLGVLPAGVYDVVLGFPGILIGLGEATLPVRDATPPLQITPDVGVAGDLVTITGKLAGTSARFDGVAATVVSAAPGQLIVHAPPHDPGPVQVSSASVDQPAAFYYLPSDTTPDAPFYEPLLFPVAFSGAGAFGSQWTTQIYLRNDTASPVRLFPPTIFGFACPNIECSGPVPPQSTVPTGTLNLPGGFLLYIPRQVAPSLHFGVLIRDLSRQAQSLGTEIPVVREKDFFDRPLLLLNVPTDPRFRVALRVYDRGTPNGIHFKVQTLSADDVLVDGFVFPAGHDPSYAQISDLAATYPQLAGKGPLRITIDPPIAGDPTLWAFASVTNNDTQQVTTVSPE